MRIGFTGAQGVGKSTLLKRMFGSPGFNGHCFISGLTRYQMKYEGVPINQQGTFEGQKALVKTMSWHLKTLQNLVIDRTLLDIYAYTVHHRDKGKLNSAELNYIRNRAKQYQHLFDVVFYIRPEFDVTGDGIRSEDRGYAVEMAGIMEKVVTQEPLGTREVVVLTGTVDERLAQIEDWCLSYENKIQRGSIEEETTPNLGDVTNVETIPG